MKKRIALACASLLINTLCYATEENKAVHDELRALKSHLIEAVNANTPDKLLPLLHEDVVLMTEVGDVLRTREGVGKFIHNLLNGPNKVFDQFTVEDVNVQENAILHGNSTAIAFGSIVSNYHLSNGKSFKLPAKWTATMVKQDNHWQIASFQNTVNVFDNPIATKMKYYMYAFCAASLVVGLVLGLLLRKKK